MNIKHLLPIFLVVLAPNSVLAQSNQTEARLFQNFFLDGSHVGSVYGEVGGVFSDFDFQNVFSLDGRIGFPIGRTFEMGVELSFLNIDPNGNFPERSGITDIGVFGRALVSDGPTNISVGGLITLPVGDEDIGGGDVNIGAFGAVRHPAGDRLALTGTLGIDFIDFGDDYEASLRLGGGVIYRTTQGWHLIGELNFLTEFDFALLTAGIDSRIGSRAHIRPALGLGLDDGAPDFALLLSFLFL